MVIVVDRVVIVPEIEKLEIVSAFSPDCRKKSALLFATFTAG
jgi:hypothetical protein